MNDFIIAISCGSTSWLNQILFHEAPFYGLAREDVGRRSAASSQSFHNSTLTLLALRTLREHGPAADRLAGNTIGISSAA